MQIPIVGWYLENRIGNHSKFYTVLVADNGVVALAWGKIGTQGQSKIQKLPTHDAADDVGRRQVYAKKSKGYSAVHSEVKFTMDGDELARACSLNDAFALTRTFAKALREPQFQGDAQAVAKHYDDFVAKAQRLMDKAGSMPFDAVYADFEELEAAWNEINDKHSEAETTLSLTKAILQQSLLSGSLA